MLVGVIGIVLVVGCGWFVLIKVRIIIMIGSNGGIVKEGNVDELGLVMD